MSPLRFMLFLGIVLVSTEFVRAGADDSVLIGVGERWKYWLATAEPPDDWRELGFDDSEWLEGDSGFGLSTWGENTLFNTFGRGSGAVFFRREFVLDDPTRVATLTLRCDWQGGYVAYLNGDEIARRQLPGPSGSPVPFDTLSALRYAGAAEEMGVGDPAIRLRRGTNVLAFQGHPAFGSPLDVVLVPELLANFTRGPYLQSLLSDRVTVLWRTPLDLPGAVEYGEAADFSDSRRVESAGPSAAQEVTLTGLQPGRRYHYRAWAGTSPSSPASFRTLPATGTLDFVLFGDSGSGHAAQFSVARVLSRRSPDLVIHLGDVVYPYFTTGLTDTRCLSVYRRLLRTTAFYATWGNHDLYGGIEPFIAAFRQPTNTTPAADHLTEGTRPEFYYSFDAGDAHFAVLFWPYSSQYYMRENCPQLQWLEADLAASTQPWKFLCLHHPVNTSGGHRADDYNYNRIPDRLEVAARLMPVAARHGVQMIFSGHDHNYERFHPLTQTHTVVTGGGGIILYGQVETDANSAFFEPRWHFSEVQIRADQLRLVATDGSGAAFDALEFRRTPAASPDPDGDGLGPLAEAALGTRPDRPDTDGDGVSDGWEYLNGWDPTVSDRQADGTHLTAFLATPLPRPAAQIQSRMTPNNELELRWLGAVGQRVILETATAPDAGWEKVPEAGGTLREDRQSLVLPHLEGTRFFRIRLEAEPP